MLQNAYQSGVIPWRTADGRIDILLISSRAQHHWVIPKGVIELGLSPNESAAKEAYEEAGVGGAVSMEPLGIYRYPKWGGICEVQVFPMEVNTVLEDWPEKNFRQREWLDIDRAIDRVQEEELKDLLRIFKNGAKPGSESED